MSMTKEKLIGVKISSGDLNLIAKAAEMERRPKSQFMLAASVKEAQRIMNSQ